MKTVVEYLKITILLFVFFLVGKMIAYCMPNDLVKANVKESAEYMQTEGIYPKYFVRQDENFYSQQADNYVDSDYLNICYFMGEHSMFETIAADYIGVVGGDDPLQNLVACVSSGEVDRYNTYARQWFGMISILRVLLVFFNFPQIRILSQYLLLFLVGVLVLKLCERFDKGIALIFLFGFSVISIDVAASCINFAGAMYCTVIGLLLVCCYYPKKLTRSNLMFIVGAVTVYVDCFSNPFITFSVAILVLLADYLESRIDSYKSMLEGIFSVGISWVSGYGVLWILKWIFGSIIIRKNIVIDALNEMYIQSINSDAAWVADTKWQTIKTSLWNMVSNIFPINFLKEFAQSIGKVPFIFLLFLVVVIVVLSLINKIKTIDNLYFSVGMLLVGTIPYVCTIVIHNHVYAHYWMWARMQVITILAVALAYRYSIESNRARLCRWKERKE